MEHFLEKNHFQRFPEINISVVNVFFPKSKSNVFTPSITNQYVYQTLNETEAFGRLMNRSKSVGVSSVKLSNSPPLQVSV